MPNLTPAEPEMREGDVFRFVYNPNEKLFSPYRCFDGQLTFKGGRLVDSYWNHGPVGRTFAPQEAWAEGTLTFICNEDEIEEVPQWRFVQYAPEDRFDLSYQHGCYKRYAIKKGAVPSLAEQRKHLEERIEDARADIRSAQGQIERAVEMLANLQEGVEVHL